VGAERAGLENDGANGAAGKTTGLDEKPSYPDGFLPGPVVFFPFMLLDPSFAGPAFSIVPTN